MREATLRSWRYLRARMSCTHHAATYIHGGRSNNSHLACCVGVVLLQGILPVQGIVSRFSAACQHHSTQSATAILLHQDANSAWWTDGVSVVVAVVMVGHLTMRCERSPPAAKSMIMHSRVSD